jgi:hypothetical protein
LFFDLAIEELLNFEWVVLPCFFIFLVFSCISCISFGMDIPSGFIWSLVSE